MVNFTFAFDDLPTTLTLVDPAYLGKRPTINFMAFLTVFNPHAWLTVALFFLLCSVCFLALEKSLRVELVLGSLAFAYDVILKMGNSATYTSVLGKLFCLILSLHAIVTMAYYEGMLTSFMTAGEPRTQIRHGFVKIVFSVSLQHANLKKITPSQETGILQLNGIFFFFFQMSQVLLRPGRERLPSGGGEGLLPAPRPGGVAREQRQDEGPGVHAGATRKGRNLRFEQGTQEDHA